MDMLREAIKKTNYQTLDIVQTSADPPLQLGRYGRKKFGRSDLARIPPSPYRSLDILTQKV